ncbi:MAG: flagellar hook-length control protein FliK [Treponemataceae bacterium]|nr:flagellar hook-length control protein FliK [Treponemataceae bacterium]
MALDILPSRPEVSTVSSTDTGYKTQGTSNGKNEGPSFSEILEKASQKDTTDGKITESDQASQKNEEEVVKSDDLPSDGEVPVTEKKVLSESKKTTSFKNQKIQVEDYLSSNVSKDMKKPVDSLESVLLDDSAEQEILSSVEETPSPDSEESLALYMVDEAHAGVEAAETPVVKKILVQEEAGTEVPVLENQEAVSDEVPLAALQEKVGEKLETPKKIKASPNQENKSENLVSLKTAESLSPEKTEVKKEKKSRFAEYDSLMASISHSNGKENPLPVTQQAALPQENILAFAPETAGTPLTGEKIQVVDLRTEHKLPEKTESEGFIKQISYDGKGNAQVSLSLMPSEGTAGYTGDIEGIDKSTFSSMLSKELESSAGDLVKTGSIVLQNNGKGSINLIIHPEELGNVKIKLELSENQISGKILVASQEAYDAFKENISVIKEAFAASGFENGGFELAWSGSGNGGNHDQPHQEHQFVQEATLNEQGMAYVDSMPDVAADDYTGSGNVNLVA